MRAALSLAPRLAVQRMRGDSGKATLDLLAVLAFTVSAFLVLTVTSGTWMFIQRWNHSTAEPLLEAYVILALMACALLVVPVLNLDAAATRLGTRGRARRLASLRLLGMSGSHVVIMSLLETLVQALTGTVLALLLWLVSLPGWTAVSFQGRQIDAAELVLPWWLLLSVVVALLVLAALSTVMGLQQVRISPLGVASHHTPRGLRAWRLGIFLLVVAAFVVFGRTIAPDVLNIQLRFYAVVMVMILLVVGAVNLVGPWLLQLAARAGALTGSPARLIAMRRIIDDPRAAWRNVSAIALLGMVSAFVGLIPTDPAFFGDDPGNALFAQDLRTGTTITLIVGLIIAATSTLISQAALVLDRTQEAVTLDRAGYPRALLTSIRRHYVFMPLIVTLVLSIGVGLLLGTPFLAVVHLEATGIFLILGAILLGLLLTIAATEACKPLQRFVLLDIRRAND